MITVEPALLDIEEGDCVLDAGCGEGRHCWEVYKRNCSTIIGLDVDREGLKKNKYVLNLTKEQGESNGSYCLVQADVTSLPFKDGSFDKIICSEVLEHVPQDRKGVKELIRVLSDKGAIGVSVPHHFAESICWMLSKDYYGFPGGHIRKYKTKHLVNLLRSNGLTIYTIRRKHSLHSFYWILRCLFGIKKERALIPSLYYKFLGWDVDSKNLPRRWFEGFLNCFIPKSIVIYARKKECTSSQ